MIYREFNGIYVENALGVCSVNSGGRDTEIIARRAAELKPQFVLDIGTGTGFIPIYLASLGIATTGADINLLAIDLARKNTECNKLSVDFFVSDLFAGLMRGRKYDLICFNPPFGDFKSSEMIKFIERIKCIFRYFIRSTGNINRFFYDTRIGRLVSVSMRQSRKDIIQRFLDGYKDFLRPKGRVLIWLHESEIPILKNYSYRIIDKFDDARACLCIID